LKLSKDSFNDVTSKKKKHIEIIAKVILKAYPQESLSESEVDSKEFS
jgi:hypothetical protein